MDLVAEPVFCKLDSITPEGVGLDRIGSCLKIIVMDPLNKIRTRETQIFHAPYSVLVVFVFKTYFLGVSAKRTVQEDYVFF